MLSIGPVLFNWTPECWRDFYFRMADEAPADAIYVGEVVCSKRAPFFIPHLEEVVNRIRAAGKQVIVSLMAEVMSKADRRQVADMLALEGMAFEVNDASQLAAVSGKPHAIGPYFNVYNEGTLCYLSHRGAEVFTLPFELPSSSMAVMCKTAAEHGVAVEVQVYGRIPLALSARCYHARAHGLTKDGCQFVCGEDSDGLDLLTLDGTPFLTINGIQTMSNKYLNLLAETDRMAAMGITRYRLSPDSGDMVEVARLFRSRLDGKIASAEAITRLSELRKAAQFADGFYHGKPGTKWTYGR